MKELSNPRQEASTTLDNNIGVHVVHIEWKGDVIATNERTAMEQ